MRVPRDKVMALGPLRGRELAWAVAGGLTPEWGAGGMARGTAAATLRLPLAPGVTRTVASPPPPVEEAASTGRTGSVCRLTGARVVGCTAVGGDGKPTPTPADRSAQPTRGAVHGTDILHASSA